MTRYAARSQEGVKGLGFFYRQRIEELEVSVRTKTQNLRRLEAQRNELNARGARVARHRVAR